MTTPILTQSRVRELFDYHPDGYLIWKPRSVEDFKNKKANAAWNAKWAGKKAGSFNDSGYCLVRCGVTTK